MPKVGKVGIVECSKCGNFREHYAKGMCASCYKASVRTLRIDVCVGCGQARNILAKGLCGACYRAGRYKQIGIKRTPKADGLGGVCAQCGESATTRIGEVCKKCYERDRHRRFAEEIRKSAPNASAVAQLTEFEQYVWANSAYKTIGAIRAKHGCTSEDVRKAFENALHAYTSGIRAG